VSDEKLAALIRQVIAETLPDALRSALHDQAVPSGARKEGACPDDETNEQGSSVRRGARTKRRGGLRFSSQAEMSKDIDDLIDTLAERRKKPGSKRSAG
jgi:hypothetical protein